MNELTKNIIISDLEKCKKMFNTMIAAINEYIHEPASIIDKDLRKKIQNIKVDLQYMNIELDFYLNNIMMVDDQTLINLTIELNNSTTQAHNVLKRYKKYLEEGDF